MDSTRRTLAGLAARPGAMLSTAAEARVAMLARTIANSGVSVSCASRASASATVGGPLGLSCSHLLELSIWFSLVSSSPVQESPSSSQAPQSPPGWLLLVHHLAT